MEEKQYDYSVNLSIDSVKLIHHCITERIKFWEGSPARPAEEQEHLWVLRDGFYSIILEDTFHNM